MALIAKEHWAEIETVMADEGPRITVTSLDAIRTQARHAEVFVAQR